jgi:NADPH:quinone reductase-like Zn-dependent oxidoreductase
MKALAIDRYGGPDVARVRDLPAPALRDGDLLIDVHAAGVNPLDFKIREGKLKRIRRFPMPLILGNEVSGVVAQVGARSSGFAVGDAVFARVEKDRLGGFAEQVAVHHACVAKKPARLTHVEAASVPLVGLTGWQALVEHAGLKAGQTVLVHAGAGGVGTFAIQLARHLGARVATTASARNHALVERLGARVVIDYTQSDFTTAIAGCDVVFDTLGGDTLLKSFAVVKPGGIVVSVAAAVPDLPTAHELGMNALLRLGIRLLNLKINRAARRRGARYRYLFMRPDGAQLAHLAALYDAGTLEPVVDRVFPLAGAREAFAYLETGHARGKVVVQVKP